MKKMFITEKVSKEKVSYIYIQVENFNDFYILKKFTESVKIFENVSLDVNGMKVYCKDCTLISTLKIVTYYINRM